MPSKHTAGLNLYSSLAILRTGQQWVALADKNLKNILNTSQSRPESPQVHTTGFSFSQDQAPDSQSPYLLGPVKDTVPRKVGSWQCVGAGVGRGLI